MNNAQEKSDPRQKNRKQRQKRQKIFRGALGAGWFLRFQWESKKNEEKHENGKSLFFSKKWNNVTWAFGKHEKNIVW